MEENKTYSCVEWLNYYKAEIEKIKTSSPFLTVLCIAAGIEFLGKLLNNDSLDGGNCNTKFNDALKNFESLKKYAGKNIYDLVRCGLAHRISVKEGVIVSTDMPSDLDSTPIVLNVDEFCEDFAKAVNEAQSKSDWKFPNANTNYVTVDKNVTGSTLTMNYQ